MNHNALLDPRVSDGQAADCYFVSRHFVGLSFTSCFCVHMITYDELDFSSKTFFRAHAVGVFSYIMFHLWAAGLACQPTGQLVSGSCLCFKSPLVL